MTSASTRREVSPARQRFRSLISVFVLRTTVWVRKNTSPPLKPAKFLAGTKSTTEGRMH